MFDLALRPVKDRALGPAADVLAPRLGALPITAVSLVSCVAAGLLAGVGASRWAVVLWLFGRAADGLDGLVARRRGSASDLGGYLDMLADTVGYAAVPLGVAVGAGDEGVWTTCAVLLASFYVNALSWTYLSALLEKRGTGVATSGEATSIRMPVGLVEGAETIVLLTVVLAWPASAAWVFALMALLVGLTVLQRARWAWRALR